MRGGGAEAEWVGKLRGMRVLLIDDLDVRREVSASHFRRLGMEVELANSREMEVLLLPPPPPTPTLPPSASLSSNGSPPPALPSFSHDSHSSSHPPQPPSSRQRFDLVALDSDAPRGKMTSSWFKLPQYEIGGAGPTPPLLLLLSRHDAVMESKAKKVGYRAVLHKPLKKGHLAAVLVEALNLKPAPLPGAREAASKEGGKEGRKLLEGFHFLVVDDNLINRKVASKLLAKFGAKVETAAGGELALNMLEEGHQFHLIFMDIQMPDMDGYETTEHIRAREKAAGKGKHVPIVAMTADVLKGTREKCLEAGMDDYIPKPINEGQLRQTVLNYCKPTEEEEI